MVTAEMGFKRNPTALLSPTNKLIAILFRPPNNGANEAIVSPALDAVLKAAPALAHPYRL